MRNPSSAYWEKIRARREGWQLVLETELRKWSALFYVQLMSKLKEEQCYEVEFGSKKYQVEVELLENTDRYVHVIVSVDDASLPASIRPMSSRFIRSKGDPTSQEA